MRCAPAHRNRRRRKRGLHRCAPGSVVLWGGVAAVGGAHTVARSVPVQCTVLRCGAVRCAGALCDGAAAARLQHPRLPSVGRLGWRRAAAAAGGREGDVAALLLPCQHSPLSVTPPPSPPPLKGTIALDSSERRCGHNWHPTRRLYQEQWPWLRPPFACAALLSMPPFVPFPCFQVRCQAGFLQLFGFVRTRARCGCGHAFPFAGAGNAWCRNADPRSLPLPLKLTVPAFAAGHAALGNRIRMQRPPAG